MREALRKLLPDLSNRYRVRSLGLFGSLQRDEHRPESDVDILVEFDDRPISLFQFITLENEFSDYLGMKMDLVEKQSLKPSIARRVLDEVSYV